MGRSLVVRWVLLAATLVLAACGGGGGGGPPLIASFSPTSGAVGTQVRIEGLLFAPAAAGNSVRFNGVAATVLSATTMALVVEVPPGATTGRIEVTTADGTATSASDFVVLSDSTPGGVWTTRLFGPSGSPAPRGLAWNGTRLVAVGAETQTSTDALVWKRGNPFSSRHDVAWDGRSFVAVGNAGIIDHSPDGLTWTLAAISGEDLHSLAGSGTTWVAVGENGAIRTSPDGLTWTTRSSPTTQTLNGVAWTGSQFIAVGNMGTVVTSSDGTSWTLQTPPTNGNLTSIAASPSLIAATTGAGSGSILTSPDGVTWTPRASGLSALNRVIFAGDRFVAVGFYFSATSSDGMTWTKSGLIHGVLDGVVHAGGQYVAIGINDNSVGATFTSPDGLSWSTRAVANDLVSIARAPTDGRMVAVGGSHSSQTSLDGITWEFGVSEQALEKNWPFLDVVWSPSVGAFISLVMIGANQSSYRSTDGKSWTLLADAPCYGALAASETMLVNIGTSLTGPCIATSPDGTAWTRRTVPAGQSLRKAFWTGSQFVAVGVSGAIATSPDGVTWTARTSGVTGVLRGVAAAPATLVIVGDSGTILSSSDGGGTWVPRTSGVSASLKRVVWTGTEFFAVGSGGKVLHSSDGTTWTQKPTQYTTDLSDIVWSPTHGRLTLVGADGLTATSP
ncbi:MAG: IPT/TIG domain-containing protein [Myxococcaceae bacterium]|nr:IPT/TIG domain-containing protein [Myxococcaceae bacterium]